MQFIFASSPLKECCDQEQMQEKLYLNFWFGVVHVFFVFAWFGWVITER